MNSENRAGSTPDGRGRSGGADRGRPDGNNSSARGSYGGGGAPRGGSSGGSGRRVRRVVAGRWPRVRSVVLLRWRAGYRPSSGGRPSGDDRGFRRRPPAALVTRAVVTGPVGGDRRPTATVRRRPSLVRAQRAPVVRRSQRSRSATAVASVRPTVIAMAVTAAAARPGGDRPSYGDRARARPGSGATAPPTVTVRRPGTVPRVTARRTGTVPRVTVRPTAAVPRVTVPRTVTVLAPPTAGAATVPRTAAHRWRPSLLR